MKKKTKFKVGEKIVEFGQVFKIFKIEKAKNSNGELEKVIYFRPCYTKNKSAGLICSIPVNNVNKTNMRKPISLNQLRKLNNELKKRRKLQSFSNINEAKELLKSNDPSDTIKLLKTLWEEKRNKSENFSKSKKDVFSSALERLVQEFASVLGVSLKEARAKINLALRG